MTKISWRTGGGGDFTAPDAMATVSPGGLFATQVPASGFSLDVATGQDASGAIQTAGDLADANWTVTNADNYQKAPIAYTAGPGDADWGGNGGWFANGPGSSWIAADPNVSANGNMTFTFKFDLTGWNPADATLSGGGSPSTTWARSPSMATNLARRRTVAGRAFMRSPAAPATSWPVGIRS